MSLRQSVLWNGRHRRRDLDREGGADQNEMLEISRASMTHSIWESSENKDVLDEKYSAAE